ncbi:MAG TPA: hypothetical protein DHV24_05170 [Candidatus Margulisbacteria bacterium]|nr:hypothetical protein [Candidatus Margulisiibacteriota bacterium]
MVTRERYIYSDKVYLAVVVQQMVSPEMSGVAAFRVKPLNSNRE